MTTTLLDEADVMTATWPYWPVLRTMRSPGPGLLVCRTPAKPSRKLTTSTRAKPEKGYLLRLTGRVVTAHLRRVRYIPVRGLPELRCEVSLRELNALEHCGQNGGIRRSFRGLGTALCPQPSY